MAQATTPPTRSRVVLPQLQFDPKLRKDTRNVSLSSRDLMRVSRQTAGRRASRPRNSIDPFSRSDEHTPPVQQDGSERTDLMRTWWEDLHPRPQSAHSMYSGAGTRRPPRPRSRKNSGRDRGVSFPLTDRPPDSFVERPSFLRQPRPGVRIIQRTPAESQRMAAANVERYEEERRLQERKDQLAAEVKHDEDLRIGIEERFIAEQRLRRVGNNQKEDRDREIARIVQLQPTSLHALLVTHYLNPSNRTAKKEANFQKALDDDMKPKAADVWGAAQDGNLQLLHALVEDEGESVDAVDSYGQTPLFAATRTGQLEIVEYLIMRHANVNHADTRGFTALHVACSAGKQDAAKYLIEHKATVDGRDVAGNTPLHIAAKHAQKDMVALLIEHHANVLMQNNLGQTPLAISQSVATTQNYVINDMLRAVTAKFGNTIQILTQGERSIRRLNTSMFKRTPSGTGVGFGGGVPLPRPRASMLGAAVAVANQNAAASHAASLLPVPPKK